ncbi:nitroreductase [Melghiribacillus thermohalophilus]|uniref:Nitroreductase n=1 Tax=Melghiribacillus thermohalophilus TaxID=1324956 RepID=A0A4R3MTJ9_9BACI|nr:nitroreductase [Melghiribacillus thermohalophilus]TCT18796.1 nitroreductase [Melghiribacillus thermohalophilus]
MDVKEAIAKRRSIRSFQEQQIPEHVLEDIFQLASWAPTHRMKEPWKLKVFQGKGRNIYVKALMRSYERLGFFHQNQTEKAEKMKQGIETYLFSIPHHVLVYMEKEEDPLKMDEDFASVSAFIQNVQLIAWSKGIGVLWTSSPCYYENGFYEEIGLHMKGHKIVGLLQMGFPKSIPEPKPRTAIQEKVEWVEEG